MRRLGCLTPFGMVAGVIAIVAVTLIALFSGGAMFSSGPLNAQTRAGVTLGGVTSHAALSKNCAACHSSPWEARTMAASCLNCHTDIQTQLASPNTLHGALSNGAACMGCHTEHKGATANITKTDLTDFPHERIGFSLATHKRTTGGRAFACDDCHTALTQSPRPSNAYALDSASCISCHVGYQADVMAKHRADFGDDCLACHDGADRYTGFNHATVSYPLVGKHADVTCRLCHIAARAPADFKVANKTCVACHQNDDVHKGGLGTDCASCHTPADWKQVTFDHNKTAFALTGAHSKVGCTNCHINHVYKGTPTTCVGCHADPQVHLGQFGTDCAACHVTSDWKQLSAFDHSKTAFALTGAHIKVGCADCHANHVYKGTSTTCVGCHAEPQKHLGQFGTDCAACHVTSDWKQVSSFDHSKTTFPLTGAHTKTGCTNCHVNNVYKGTPTSCVACHQSNDVHKGALGTNCASCHTTSAWKQVTFNHSKTAFPLTGAHTKAACASCHGNHVYKGTPTTCVACHAEPQVHLGKYGTDCAACHSTSSWAATFDHSKTAFPLVGAHTKAVCASCHVNNVFKGTPTTCVACHQKDDAHKGAFGTDCASCHTASGWGQVSFDHSKTAFPLTGAHTKAGCTNCHANNVYKGTPTTCVACHAEPQKHLGQFGTNCAACHTTTNWDAAFDHSKTAFPLTGAHTNAGCANCHANNVYKGTPTTCVACHADPQAHLGQFGTDCAACHSTSSWKNATFKHNFPLNHGGEGQIPCATCHTNPGPQQYQTYTCYRCHAEAKMISKHREEGINDIANCVRCHADGRKHD
ncbi:MAG: cytochrome c3 family protein [Chloroflexales bacterium]